MLGQTDTGLAADGNNDGVVDQADFDVWRDHFGQMAGSGAGAIANVAVPEPTPVSLLHVGMFMMRFRRRTIVS